MNNISDHYHHRTVIHCKLILILYTTACDCGEGTTWSCVLLLMNSWYNVHETWRLGTIVSIIGQGPLPTPPCISHHKTSRQFLRFIIIKLLSYQVQAQKLLTNQATKGPSIYTVQSLYVQPKPIIVHVNIATACPQ